MRILLFVSVFMKFSYDEFCSVLDPFETLMRQIVVTTHPKLVHTF